MSPPNNSLSIGLIGFGAIGQTVYAGIQSGSGGRANVSSILVQTPKKHTPNTLITSSFTEFLNTKPDLVVEAAGQPALKEYGVDVVNAGISLLVTSMGAFTDDTFWQQMVRAADQPGNGRLLLAAGALPALDWMSGIPPEKITKLTISQTKPVKSWVNTPARDLADLTSLTEVTCFFDGTARQAASTFPKSSNITAMLALATIGLDNTRVNLYANPLNDQMLSVVELESSLGSIRVERKGVPSELNPSTSADVPYAVLKAIRNYSSAVVFGV